MITELACMKDVAKRKVCANKMKYKKKPYSQSTVMVIDTAIEI